MAERTAKQGEAGSGQFWLLVTLEKLLAIDTFDISIALSEAADLVGKAVGADKVDIFLYDPTIDSLVAQGVSYTPMSQKELALGLDRLPISNGGRTVHVYKHEETWLTGRADLDPLELPGVVNGLDIRSVVAVPFYAGGSLRGAIQIDSAFADAFTEYDLRFLEAVASWIGTITHKAELMDQLKREAREEARRAAAEELVTIIAHDLGNYLAPLFGRVGLIRLRASRAGQEQFVQDADDMMMVLRRLERMVRDLMDVGRLEQGIFTLNKKPVDVVAMTRESAQFLSTAECTVNVNSFFDTLEMEIDPDRLRQATENLMSNGLKHSPDSAPVTVTIGTENRADGEWVIIAVVDQGPGISPEVMPRLFTRFAPGPDSKGLGLGLYMAQGIARAHGGTLTAESEEGSGAKFVLALPRFHIDVPAGDARREDGVTEMQGGERQIQYSEMQIQGEGNE